MHYLLTAIGSAGDVFPFVGIGRELLRRGHQVTLLTNGYFEPLARRQGLDFVAVGSEDDFRASTRNERLWHPREGFREVMRYVGPLYPRLFREVTQRYEPGRTLVVSHFLDMGSRVAQEARGVANVTIALQPLVFRSEHVSPTWTLDVDLNRYPRWFKRGFHWLTDFQFVDPVLGPPLNALRFSVGLPPIRRAMGRWIFSPLATLGLFPEWFAPPQPDWPPGVRLTGFPLYDAAEPTPGEVHDFLEAGDRPIVFTPGSAVTDPGAFVAAAADACTRLGRRGLILSRFAAAGALPPGVMVAPFAPLTEVLPRAVAAVHHGGIGTTAAALAAGVPQLHMPMSHDQPDNAARVKQLGVGDWIRPRDFGGLTVARTLGRLLGDETILARARQLGERVRAENGLARTCDELEAVARESSSRVGERGLHFARGVRAPSP